MNLAELDEPNSYHGAVQISACVGWKSRSHHRPMLILALNYLEVAQILTGPHREAPRGSSTCSCHSAGLLQLCIACRFTSSVLPEIVLLPKGHFRPSSSPAAVPGPSHIQNHAAARFPATEPRVLQCQVSTTTRQSWMILKCACHLTSSHCWHSERHPRPPPPSRPEEAVEFFASAVQSVPWLIAPSGRRCSHRAASRRRIARNCGCRRGIWSLGSSLIRHS